MTAISHDIRATMAWLGSRKSAKKAAAARRNARRPRPNRRKFKGVTGTAKRLQTVTNNT